MKILRQLAGLIVPALYLACVAGAVVLFWISHQDPFCAIPLMLLGLPWSIGSYLATDHFAPGLFTHSTIPALVLTLLGCLFNLGLLYWLTRPFRNVRPNV